MVSKLGNIHQVVDDSGHDDTGFVFIKVGEWKFLQMGEDVAAHVCLHANTHNMTLILHDILHNGLDDIDDQKRCTPGKNQLEIFVRNVGIDDVSGNDRVHQVAAGRNQRAYHVQYKQLPVRFVVAGKRFQHDNTLLTYFLHSFLSYTILYVFSIHCERIDVISEKNGQSRIYMIE